MMSNKETKEYYIEYFKTQELNSYVLNILPLTLMDYKGKTRTDVNVEQSIKSIRTRAKDIGLNEKSFERFLGMTITGLLKGNRPKALSNFVSSHSKMIHRKICSIPNSLDKAYDALRAVVEVDSLRSDQDYDAFVLLSDEVDTKLISRELKNWRKEEERHRAVHFGFQSDVFWVSADFHEDIDGISRYRFRETFNFGEFESAFSEVESMFEINIATAAAGMSGMSVIYGSSELQILAFELWLASRSPRLSNRIKDSISLAMYNIPKVQSPEGWWSDVNVLLESNERDLTRKPRYLPSVYITALCSLDLLKLSIQDSHMQSGILGAEWILSKQNTDGSWSRERVTTEGIVYEPEVFITVLALEVLIRSGIKNIEHSIELGTEWLIKKQEDFGTWDDASFPFPFMTIVVLELLKMKENYPAVLNQYQSVSRGFLQRAAQLSLEDNNDSRRLALIAAYHGLEAFLYSALSHPGINIPIFKKGGERTIGMKAALDKFQAHLREEGIIKPAEAVLYRNSLDRLAYLRDQIVHKAVNVSTTECEPWIEDAFRFTRKYSLALFNIDILS